MQRELSQQDIADQAGILLRHFMADRFEREGIENAPPVIDEQAQQNSDVWEQVGSTLRQIGDILDQDQELQR